MVRAKYDTDLSDEDWNAVAGVIPQAGEGGRPRSVDMTQLSHMKKRHKNRSKANLALEKAPQLLENMFTQKQKLSKRGALS